MINSMKKYIVLSIALFFGIQAKAQFENKLNAFAYTGLPIYKADDGGQAFKNVFNGYKPLPYIGAGLDYAFNLHFSIGPSIRIMYAKKSNYKIPNTTVGLELKYNILPNDKKFSPFVVSEFSSTYLSITQNEFVETISDEIKESGKDVTFLGSDVLYPERSIKLDNVPGMTVGVGSDFTLKQKYGVFVSFNYMFTGAHKHAKLQEVYPDNGSKYSYFLIKLGFKFGFLKSNSL